MENTYKKISEVFKNYDEENQLKQCDVLKLNFYKNLGKLELLISSVEKIKESEIEKFETYIKNSFQIKEINIEIKYETRKGERCSPATNLTTKPNENSENKSSSTDEQTKTPLILGRTSKITEALTKVIEITVDSGKIALEGEIVNIDQRELKTGKILLMIDIYDGTSTITCKSFIEKDKFENIFKRIKDSKRLKIIGIAQYDPYAKEIGVMTNTIIELPQININKRKDNSTIKRVELHLHTQMSQMDGVSSATDLIKLAASFGMKSIAITDHGVVQAFPEAHAAAKKNNIKIIYGVEGYLVSDIADEEIVNISDDNKTYSILDIETTGFAFRTEKITEIAVMKIKNGKLLDKFECFVNPEKPIPRHITEITGITSEMVKNADTIKQIIPQLLEFVKDTIIVAHNAEFDLGFIRYNANNYGYELKNESIDTLKLCRELFPEFKKHKLGIVAENLGIKVENAHRAMDDVETLAKVFEIIQQKIVVGAPLAGIHAATNTTVPNSNDPIPQPTMDKATLKTLQTNHVIILVKNYEGLKNLYKLISTSHLDYFYKKPRILKSILNQYRSGLIVGSACEAGELYKSIIIGKDDEAIEKTANYYDFLEIQPNGNNMFLVRNGTVANLEELKNINKKIIKIGEKLNKLVVATGDVHFAEKTDEIYRRILMAGQGYEDADNQAPLYFRTTEEMLEEFDYLDYQKAVEVVITNTNKISDMCEEIQPVPDGTFPPNIEGSEEQISEISMSKAKEIYGDPLPEIVRLRLEKELNSIIKNGFAVMYIIAQKLVWKSNENGYLVGSRGSVGSSLAAFMTGITEVNSLPPHYICSNCKYSDFDDYGCKNGADLPDKQCPKCGNKLNKDGMDIPFETFLGFDGDKAPDIDLNFSGEYQAKAHKHTEELFGVGKTFKAGTIGTIADKTAFGYVKGYYTDKNITLNNAEISRIIKGCVGVKRTTGQHPGGIIVVPEDKEIYDFCPIQHPANDVNSDIITTHFDFHSIHDNLLKLDILGHDDPTVIKMLEDLTGINAKTIPLDDKETMSLFSSTKALKVESRQINSVVGTFGVPEFGTKFVRQMLEDTKPKTFEELIRISGLSHGTDVWINNAQELVKSGTATLSEAICTRDDIMIYLIKEGLPPKMSFKIMESVRKGKGLTEEMETAMIDGGIADWYILSCKKIKYMFPKAHAAAYVTMAFRIAWFKVNFPLEYYTAFFTVRADEFDSDSMIYGKEKVKNKMKELEMQIEANVITTKDKNMYGILEIVLEMYERGFEFLPIDLYKSQASKFLLESGKIRPPFCSIPGLGATAANGIENARLEGQFMSVEDLKIKGKIGKAVIELLGNSGCLEGIPKSNQLSLFDMN